MKRLLILSGIMVSTLLVLSACMPAEEQYQPAAGSESPLDKDLTVEQASEIIGLPIPVPEYLPPGSDHFGAACKSFSAIRTLVEHYAHNGEWPDFRIDDA